MTSMFISPPKRTTRAGTKLIEINNKKPSNDQNLQSSLNETFPTGGDALSGDTQTEPTVSQTAEGAGVGGPLTAQSSDTAVPTQRATGAIPKVMRGGTPVGRGRGSRGATPILNEHLRCQLQETTYGTLTTRLDQVETKLARVETLENKIDLLLQKLSISNSGEINNNIEIPPLNSVPGREGAASGATGDNETLNHIYSSDEESDEVDVNLNTESSRMPGNGQRGRLIDIDSKIQLLYQDAREPPRERSNSPRAFVPYRHESERKRTANIEPSNSFRNIDNDIQPLRQNARRSSREILLGTGQQSKLLQNRTIPINERGLVEGEFRRVHFGDENRSANLNARSSDANRVRRPNDVRHNLRNSNVEFNHQANGWPYDTVKLTITRLTPEGELVSEDNFVTNEEYRQITRNRSGPPHRENLTFDSQPRYAGHTETPRRGTLSWRSSESSDSDDDARRPNEHSSSRSRTDNYLTDRYGGSENPSPYAYDRELNSAMKIGRIVSNWKITFPKTERDPEQFLLILKDQLSVSGINKDLFVPCLSNIFEGPYRAWYLLNKQRWRTWRDFARAFRFQWGVKKDDGALFLEVHNLKLEKGENLAEFTCRARLIFERMRHPPTFREQLKQILVKFNPRLTFEILNLPINNYDEFLHYINERSYLYRRSSDVQRGSRDRTNKTELKYLQDETDEDDTQPTEDEDNDVTELQAIQQKTNRTDKKNLSDNSKTLVRQRLEHNLTRFEKNNKTSTVNPSESSKETPTKFVSDLSKMLCYNCGETGHAPRWCTADRQIVCHVCRRKGHTNKDCPTRPGNE
ncbi:uncharacterized protein [Temnothorax longispinosus]|uniref:uncharacterized protein n=1 Tax=Temnothorax longispinosus TaxID=300112 RepID=UPI003A998BF9